MTGAITAIAAACNNSLVLAFGLVTNKVATATKAVIAPVIRALNPDDNQFGIGAKKK